MNARSDRLPADELGARLTQLLESCGLERKAVIERANTRLRAVPRKPGGRVPQVTAQRLSDWTRGRHRPGSESLLAVVRVAIEAARRRVQQGHLEPDDLPSELLNETLWKTWHGLSQSGKRHPPAQPSPPYGALPGSAPTTLSSRRLVAAADPLQLGVHRALASTAPVALAALPAYLPRHHDVELQTLLSRTVDGHGDDRSVLVVLTGDSSVGKTRALWEAARAQLPDWVLLVPATVAELRALLEAGKVRPGTVLWLNETQRFLEGPGGEWAAVLLTTLLDGTAQVVVLAAMWERPYWQALTAQGQDPDTYAAARILLTSRWAHHFHIPDHLDSAQLDDFAKLADSDPRMAAALAAGRADGKVIQHLTGGPELLAAFLDGAVFTRIEHALISTAIEARNLGHNAALPAALLTAAVDGYLHPRHRPAAHTDLDTALIDLARGHRVDGTRNDIRRTLTALSAVRDYTGADPAYEPDHYLLQHKVQKQPEPAPAALWEALLRHTTSREDRLRLGRAANARGLQRIAVSFLESAATASDSAEVRLLATLHQRAEHQQQAKAWQALDPWDEEGIPACTATIDWQYQDLGRALLQIGLHCSPDIEELRHHALREGPPTATYLIRECQRLAFTIAMPYAQAARAWQMVPDLRDTLLSAYHPTCNADDRVCGRFCQVNGNRDADEKHWSKLSASGDIEAMRILARLRMLQEHLEEAEELLRRSVESGKAPTEQQTPAERAAAMRDLAHLLQRTERQSEGDRWLQRAADAGDLDASCELLDQCGRGHQARQLLRHAIETGNWLAEDKLIKRLREAGHDEEAERLYRFGIEPGGSTAKPW